MYLSSNKTLSLLFRYTSYPALFVFDKGNVFNSYIGKNNHFNNVTILTYNDPAYIREKYK